MGIAKRLLRKKPKWSDPSSRAAVEKANCAQPEARVRLKTNIGCDWKRGFDSSHTLYRRAPKDVGAPGRPSCVLPSHGLHRSTLGDGALNFRVRNGTGCGRPSLAAGPSGGPACGEPPWRSHSAQTVLSISSPATSPAKGACEKSSAD